MPNLNQQEILNWKAFFKIKALESKDKRLSSFYNASTYHADTKLKDIEFVALDFETTGLDAKKNSIISIGLVPFTLQRIACREAKHWFVTPEDKLKEDSIVIHGITHSDLKGAPSLLRILEQLLDELAGKVVVVHYRRIERDFLHHTLRSLINEGIIFPLVDTMQIEADMLAAQPKKLIDLLRKPKPTSIRLANTRSRYNLPVYPPHDALTDAIATAELLQAQIHYHFSPDTPINKLWL
ncbi:3'-5' exonuclease [Agarivorans sp. OAG1]|uniref:3'-5' exonuclease n=1 Tax=unclassified Agarivorans TaxID=2636026 RepID=UPI00128BC727|nr:3'-5' exonuclease [Agarivorans sp. B2Z047]MPW29253.1 3'-5' exonuclease [Agarivorans sp. B2Z047]UQN41806.1 3'-5' exonuclease [Agarivorans sp. B2Z047]BEU02213.1 3'-5' exonuclease [Agarivorans sp. OAG1]